MVHLLLFNDEFIVMKSTYDFVIGLPRIYESKLFVFNMQQIDVSQPISKINTELDEVLNSSSDNIFFMTTTTSSSEI